jgi:hypothetical protein
MMFVAGSSTNSTRSGNIASNERHADLGNNGRYSVLKLIAHKSWLSRLALGACYSMSDDVFKVETDNRKRQANGS